ncbi:hypothetical protein [Spiroplasma ixodetis]|uniref:Transmembrane protein n=1 Tax=Spiroplasma ixodetis TaxID=2141 RepID=A0ABN7BVK1_9MOLU
MRIRNWSFISFYLLLITFIIYELFFLIALSKNTVLKDLYYYGFEIAEPSPSFNPSSYTAVYYLPVIGLIVSSFGLISCIFTARVFLEKSPRFKFVFLVVNFIIFVVGFLISFSGQLLYCEWSNDSAQIIPNRGGTIETPSFYYRNWFSSTIVWSIFGFYFALLVAAVILLLKLNLINVQTYHFYRQRIEQAIEFEPELKQPLPSSNEFDPNDTQTITIFLDEEVNEKLQSKTNRKKIIKSSKNNKKKLNSKKKTNKVEKKVSKIKKS